MLPLVAKISSSSEQDFKFFDHVGAAEIVALIAIIVSVVTWFQSRAVEERIRADGKECSKFDTVFGTPLTARLGFLEGIITDFGRCIRTATNIVGVPPAISKIQKEEHAEWFFAMDSLLESYHDAPSGNLRTILDDYWENSSFLINEIDNALDLEQAAQVHRRLRLRGDQYLKDSRKTLVDHRANLKGVPAPIFKNPFKSSKTS